MSAEVFVDTNILVYLFDAGAPEKRARARAALEALTLNGGFVVSTQVLQETYVVLTRKLSPPLSGEAARNVVLGLAENPCVSMDSGLVLNAIDIANRHRLSLWDALILAAAKAAGCTRLLTEDLATGATLEGVLIESPFPG